MRFYLRTGRHSGMSVGLFGAMFLAPFVMMYWSIWITYMFIVWTIKVVVWCFAAPAIIANFFSKTHNTRTNA